MGGCPSLGMWEGPSGYSPGLCNGQKVNSNWLCCIFFIISLLHFRSYSLIVAFVYFDTLPLLLALLLFLFHYCAPASLAIKKKRKKNRPGCISCCLFVGLVFVPASVQGGLMYRPWWDVASLPNTVVSILQYCPIMIVVDRLVHILYALKYNLY